jgi:hypothetical protein
MKSLLLWRVRKVKRSDVLLCGALFWDIWESCDDDTV